MPQNVHIRLAADGQGLRVDEAPRVLASASVQRVEFDVTLSEHWLGFLGYYVLLRRAGGIVRACEIDNGAAIADADAIAGAGALQVAIYAEGNGRKLTSSCVIIGLENSGL